MVKPLPNSSRSRWAATAAMRRSCVAAPAAKSPPRSCISYRSDSISNRPSGLSPASLPTLAFCRVLIASGNLLTPRKSRAVWRAAITSVGSAFNTSRPRAKASSSRPRAMYTGRSILRTSAESGSRPKAFSRILAASTSASRKGSSPATREAPSRCEAKSGAGVPSRSLWRPGRSTESRCSNNHPQWPDQVAASVCKTCSANSHIRRRAGSRKHCPVTLDIGSPIASACAPDPRARGVGATRSRRRPGSP